MSLESKEKSEERLTDFGYSSIPEKLKEKRVKKVFDTVAPKYDVMNDVLSWGLHRLWKNSAVKIANIKSGMKILDIAGGTADMSLRMSKLAGKDGQIWLTDINSQMLQIGKKRMENEHCDFMCIVCDAEKLPFHDCSFDRVIVSFGLRNMTHKDKALAEMLRVVKKGGEVLVLEFSRPSKLIRPFYDFYSFKVMPFIASKIVGAPDNYRYLAESIRMHPNQKSLAKMMKNVGFDSVEWRNYCFGITALHIGRKIN